MKTVILKNGAEELEGLVLVVSTSLEDLMKNRPIAFYELVQVCKNPNHKLFGNTKAILEEFAIIQNDTVHDSIRNIVLSMVEGKGLDMRLVNPIAA